MFKIYSKTFAYILDKWPGKNRLGIYRFLPFFFVLGATVEYAMINWHAGQQGEINFYNTYKKRAVQEQAAKELLLEKNLKVEKD